jgi:hypothetical protein
MKSHSTLLIAAAVLIPALTTYSVAEQSVVVIKQGTKAIPGCALGFTKSDSECGVPSLANEATGTGDLWTPNVFKVYTTNEIDKKLGDIEKSIKQGFDHNAQVLGDTTQAILKRIDKLPAQLPMDAGFYKQMRERLKADIGAELDKAKQGVTGPAQ